MYILMVHTLVTYQLPAMFFSAQFFLLNKQIYWSISNKFKTKLNI